MEDIKGIILDTDGTLVEWKTNVLLEGVKDWFFMHKEDYKLAFCSNQGGVGCRYWMQSGGWGDPDSMPAEEDLEEAVEEIKKELGVPDVDVYMCYAYVSKKGHAGPVPDGVAPYDWQWDTAYRKPNPAMLLLAACEMKLLPKEIMMVGDRIEDQKAAYRAGMAFMWADEFFERRKVEHV